MIKIMSSEAKVVATYKSFTFSGGEVSVKIDSGIEFIDTAEFVSLLAIIRNSDDLMELLMLTDAIRQINPSISIFLTIPYLPYARQDRVMVPGESLSIKVFANIINAQNYEAVSIWDAHSDVGLALIDRSYNMTQVALIEIIQETLKIDLGISDCVLVSPDAGAEKKIYKFAKEFGVKDIVFASKIRDVSTGAIVKTVINNPPETPTDKDFLIVDDICDGGRTFIELAAKLRPYTTGKIKLLVTHGIFSKGVEVFDGVIDEVITLLNINRVVSTEKTKVVSYDRN